MGLGANLDLRIRRNIVPIGLEKEAKQASPDMLKSLPRRRESIAGSSMDSRLRGNDWEFSEQESNLAQSN